MTKVKIKQFKNKAKEPIAGLTPEHAIYDTNGVRLDAKLGNVNLQEFRDLQQQCVNNINAKVVEAEAEIDAKHEEVSQLTQASMISSNTEGLKGNNVEEKLTDAGEKLFEVEQEVYDLTGKEYLMDDMTFGMYINPRGASLKDTTRAFSNIYIPIVNGKEYLIDNKGYKITIYLYDSLKNFSGNAGWFADNVTSYIATLDGFMRLGIGTSDSSELTAESYSSPIVISINSKIDNIDNNVKDLASEIEKNEKGNYSVLWSSLRFHLENTLSEESNTNIYPDCQDAIVGKKIIGIKISILKEGMLRVVKCSGFRSNTHTETTIGEFSVTKGINYIAFDREIEISNDEMLGVCSMNSCAIVKANYNVEGNQGYYYSEDGRWYYSPSDIVMAILERDNSYVSKNVNDLQDNLDKLNLDFDKIKQGDFAEDGIALSTQIVGAYVRYSDGEIVDTSSYNTSRTVYIIHNIGYTKITTKVANLDTIPAAIAFYKSEEPNTDNYMGGVQITTDSSVQTAIVPDGCKLICVTNQNTKEANPYIFFNFNFFSLAKDINQRTSLYDSLLVDESFKSQYFNRGGNQNDSAAMRFFTSVNGNEKYRGREIIGIRFYASGNGRVQIIKGVGLTINKEPNYEVLQENSVIEGLNTIILDVPVVCEGVDDYIGINGTGFQMRYHATYDNTNIWTWWQEEDGTMSITQKDSVVSIITAAVGNADDVIEVKKKVNSIGDTVTGESKLKHFLWTDYPYYYHWSPDGFNNDVPSQSIEDNFLAKRFGFKFVEVNSHTTGTPDKYIVTHGNGGTFGAEFAEPYKSTQIGTMTYDDIVANVKYNSRKATYNHTISTGEAFFKNCAQLSLGVYLRQDALSLIELARKYIPEDMIVAVGGNDVRKKYNFYGILTTFINSTYYPVEEVCNIEWFRNFVNTHGGAPYHLILMKAHIKYMIDNGTLDEIVGILRSEGIYIAACYCDTATLDRLTAAGGCGHAADNGQCNPFGDPNYGVWSPLDSSLSEWTIPSGITNDGGRLVNSTNEMLEVVTPSTEVLPLAKGQVQARVKGNVSFIIGDREPVSYKNYDENIPICFALGDFNKNMRLKMDIEANSSVEFLSYQVSRC